MLHGLCIWYILSMDILYPYHLKQNTKFWFYDEYVFLLILFISFSNSAAKCRRWIFKNLTYNSQLIHSYNENESL